jgi:hypothetical protein
MRGDSFPPTMPLFLRIFPSNPWNGSGINPVFRIDLIIAGFSMMENQGNEE